MSPARYLSRNEYDGLRARFRALLRLVGGTRAAEAVTRVSYQALERYGSAQPEHEDRFAPIDIIADLEAECGDPLVTRQLADMAGFLLVRKIDAEAAACDIGALCAITHDSAQVVAVYGAALADQKISPTEARALRAAIGKARVAFAALDLRMATLDVADGADG